MAAETAADAIYRALRSPEPNPDLAHADVEEIRDLGGLNVIAVVGTQIAELKVQIADFRAEMKAEITEIRAEVKAQGSRIDMLQKVIWPLTGLLATTVFGLLYKAVTG